MSRKSNSRPNQREGIRWEATGRNALKFLVEVQPYLVEKRLQADLAIQYQHRIIEMNCRGGKGHSPEDRRWFEDVRDRVRALKHEVHTYSVTRPLTERAGR